MELDPFIRGLLVGLAVAVPVGPMSLLCMRRTLADGFPTGFVSGVGVATADALYGAIAAFGLTLLAEALLGAQQPLRLVGGLFLCNLGVRTMLAQPGDRAASASAGSLLGAYLSMCGLTLANPTTILSFAAIFAGLGLLGGAPGAGAAMVLGVFLGSAAWWLVLTGAVGALRARLGPRPLRLLNLISGLLLAALGGLALASLLQTA
jgi:threonine/homoserine/homoserine lactone efflux protein